MNGNQEPKEKVKGCLIGVGLLIVALASLSHLITSSEAIPDKARFVYDTRLKIIVPCPEVDKPAFFPVPGKFNDVSDSVDSKWDGVVTWGELREKNGKFAAYNMPKGWGWNDFVFYGRPVPLWKNMLFKPKSRWDDSGNWKY